jgi:hypothetical protein
MLRFLKLSLTAALVLGSSAACGQSTLGALLDAGARKLSVEEFKAEVVQRTVVGPTGTGVMIEVMYTLGGTIGGVSTTPFIGTGVTMDGTWRIDSEGRTCTSLRADSNRGGLIRTQLPPRCQFWFKLDDTYYLSDSDRYTKVLPRRLK